MNLNKKINTKLKNEIHLIDKWTDNGNEIILEIENCQDRHNIFDFLNDSALFKPLCNGRFIQVKEAK